MSSDDDTRDTELGARLRAAEHAVEHLSRVVERERAARETRRELQRLVAASVAATTIDEVVTTIVRGSSDVLGSHISTVALPEPDDRVRFVHLDTAPAGLRTDWALATRATEVPLVRALDPDATWIELLDRTQIDEWPILAAEADRAELGSYVCVPLRARGTRVPIASLGFGFRTPTALDALDRALIAELSEVASDALERVGQLQHARSVAETLQHALLPRRLPKVDGLALRSIYQPGADQTDVGGDWYDVVRLADGGVGLVVGDVAGHDMASAAEMGRIRHVLASHLVEHGDPARALTIADRYFAAVDESTFATALVVTLDADRSEMCLAAAGHLPPIVVGARGGSAGPLDLEPGPPIGSGLGGHGSIDALLDPGATVVAFTDGVVERRDRPIDACVAELAAALAAVDDPDPTTLLRVVREHLDSPDRGDDAAALIATRT